MHDKVTTPEETGSRPVNHKASSLRCDIVDELEFFSYGRESKEIIKLLHLPHIKVKLLNKKIVSS